MVPRRINSESQIAQRSTPSVESELVASAEIAALGPPTSRSIDWYAEGESRTVLIDDARVVVRVVGRKGRRTRIAITAPAGTIFVDGDMTASALPDATSASK